MTNKSIDVLDDDCLMGIFSFLSLSDYIHVQKVCSRWELLCQSLWRSVKKLDCEGGEYIFTGKYNRRQVIKSIDCLEPILKCCGSFIRHFHLSKPNNNVTELTTIFTIIAKYSENIQIIFISIEHSESDSEKLTIRTEDISLLLSRNQKLIFFSLECDFDEKIAAGEFLNDLPSSLAGFRLVRCMNLSPKFVTAALEKLKHLHVITFLQCEFIQNDVIEMIIDHVHLKRLNLALCDIKDADIKNITNNCRQVEMLDISGCLKLTNLGLCDIAKLENLVELRISNLEEVTDKVIDDLPSTLKQFRCSTCKMITDDGIIRLIKRAPNLSSLDVRHCDGITNRTIEAAIEVAKARTNDVVLVIYYFNTQVELSKLEKMYGRDVNKISPFLRIFEHINRSRL